MENKSKNTNVPKAKGFLKKYGYYILLALCIAMLVVIIVLSVANGRGPVEDAGVIIPPSEQPKDTTPSPSPGGNENPKPPAKVAFIDPMLNMEISQAYSATMIRFVNNQFSTHLATDYAAATGTEVKAVYDGVVMEVGFEQYLDGGYIVIKHDNEWTTVYRQLSNELTLEVGDNVTKGQVIGKVGTGYGIEKAFGPHLHFEVLQHDVLVDPEVVFSDMQK